MQLSPFTAINERPDDAAAIAELHEEAFGPGQYARTAYRLREGVPHDPSLSFVALTGTELVGSVRLTPILVGDRAALLLGPLAVKPSYAGRGAGKMLVRTSLEAARQAGHAVALLVGDEPYYGPLGFVRVKRGSVTLPGPVDPFRILAAELQPGTLADLRGLARKSFPGV
jgi:predicted N-acetyltransferase YhbS